MVKIATVFISEQKGARDKSRHFGAFVSFIIFTACLSIEVLPLWASPPFPSPCGY